jgi:disulfide bond formation protein DsbB
MSKESISVVIQSLATLVLAGQVLAVFLIGILVYVRLIAKRKKLPNFVQMISNNSLAAALLVAVIAMLGSLFLSEIAHFIPCKLCWYQRICMYPQVILLGIGFWKNDLGVKKYALPLAIIGFVIATYHYILQMYPGLPCTDEVASCAAKQFASYGYITIPLMAWTAFSLIILFLLFPRKK